MTTAIPTWLDVDALRQFMTEQEEETITDTCDRCGGLDESNGGTANMVDGKNGLCADCASDMGLI